MVEGFWGTALRTQNKTIDVLIYRHVLVLYYSCMSIKIQHFPNVVALSRPMCAHQIFIILTERDGNSLKPAAKGLPQCLDNLFVREPFVKTNIGNLRELLYKFCFKYS